MCIATIIQPIVIEPSTTCRWPVTCTSKAEHDGYCLFHKMYSEVPEPPKLKKPIAKESKKTKKENRQYRKQVAERLEESPWCELNSPVCTHFAQGDDHTQKRSPANKMLLENRKRSCNACNTFKENNLSWAIANGHHISKYAIIEI